MGEGNWHGVTSKHGAGARGWVALVQQPSLGASF